MLGRVSVSVGGLYTGCVKEGGGEESIKGIQAR